MSLIPSPNGPAVSKLIARIVAHLSESGRVRQYLIQSLGLGTFYVAVVAFFSVASPVFLTYSNAVNVLSNASVIGIVSIGQALAIISGGFDLSVGGTIPLAAVLYAILSNDGVPTVLAMTCAVASGGGFGLVNGVIITRLGINPLITTLGTMSIGVGLAFSVTDGLTTPLNNIGAGFLANTTFGDITYYMIALLVTALLFHFVLKNTTFGRMIYAIGGNREASRLAGMRVEAVSIVIYALSGCLAAFAGVIVTSELLAGSPTVGSDAVLQSVAAVILGGAALTGGVGGIGGTMLGVLLLGTIANGLALLAVPPFYQQIATGVTLLVAVAFSRLRASALSSI
jgi:ribose transport system permease protein